MSLLWNSGFIFIALYYNLSQILDYMIDIQVEKINTKYSNLKKKMFKFSNKNHPTFICIWSHKLFVYIYNLGLLEGEWWVQMIQVLPTAIILSTFANTTEQEYLRAF